MLRVGIICLLTLCPIAASNAQSTFWAFQTPKKALVPKIQGAMHPVDAFLLQKLQAKGLGFAPPADRRTLIRRATFDLHGLPPSPAETAAFLADGKPGAWERLIDRLLASPRYGERWGRHWLDVVRFGETDGGEHNHERWNSWPYRDYVINSLNRDVPYDQFIREQIAGDTLFPGEKAKMAATGFLVAGPWDQVTAELTKDPILKKTARMDELDDMVTTCCATFLALTVNCARCHDHKFDPIPTKDYYRLTAVFSGAGFGERSIATKQEQADYEAKALPFQTEIGLCDAELAKIEDRPRTRLLQEKYRAAEAKRPVGMQRIALNPIYNRALFNPVAARYWKLTVTGTFRGTVNLAQFALGSGAGESHGIKASTPSSPERPFETILVQPQEIKPISQVEWWSDQATGKPDGAPQLYQLAYSHDRQSWTPISSNLDHINRLEEDLPTVTDGELDAAITAEQRAHRAELRKRRSTARSKLDALPKPSKLYTCKPLSKPEEAFVLERGSPAKPKEAVTPGALSIINQLADDFGLDAASTDGQRRQALTNWIANPKNPLTARVMVNRAWYYHFGNGIVNTPSDFGANGDAPSHPELLDWLAVNFVEQGWSLKRLHKLIMTSQAYRQSDTPNPKAQRVDAANRLVWHMPLKRMDAEMLRDSILKVAGTLDLTMGGPSFQLHSKGDRGSYIYHALDNDGPAVWRRAVYRFTVRGGDKTLLDSFDCPDPSVATPQRQASNTPVQALSLMNNAFVLRQADLLAQRLSKERVDVSGQVARVYQLTLSRVPTSREIAIGRSFAAKHSLAQFCRALLNANEFVFVP